MRRNVDESGEPGQAAAPPPSGPSPDPRRGAAQAIQTMQQRVDRAERPRRWLARHRWAVFLAYLIGMAAFVALAIAAHRSRVLPGDVVITLALQRVNSPYVLWLMQAVSSLGYSPLSPTIVVAALVVLWLVRLRLEAVFLALATGMGELLDGALKQLIGRHRPTPDLVHVTQVVSDPSFPSGHVMHYTIFYGFLAFAAATHFRPSWTRNLFISGCVALVVLVGASRVYLGEHWPSDVLGAYLAGGLWLGAVIAAYLWVEARFVVLGRPPWIARRLIDEDHTLASD
jgi:membrane-associated phospholipid phosphatase